MFSISNYTKVFSFGHKPNEASIVHKMTGGLWERKGKKRKYTALLPTIKLRKGCTQEKGTLGNVLPN